MILFYEQLGNIRLVQEVAGVGKEEKSHCLTHLYVGNDGACPAPFLVLESGKIFKTTRRGNSPNQFTGALPIVAM
jgi:hypothetical protein